MGHNVGVAAAKAVERSNRTSAESKTPEQRIKSLRGLLAAGLYVQACEQRFLLEQYDLYVQKRNWLDSAVKSSNGTIELLQAQVKNLQEALSTASATILKLGEENEQFRVVYEQENSSRGTVQVVAEIPAESGIDGPSLT